MITKNIWGPYIWYIMHIVSFNYPNSSYYNNLYKTNKLYESFYNHIYSIIPCTICKEHYKNQLKKYPIKLYIEKNKLDELIIFYHNNVNALNHKKKYSYNQVKKLYFDENNNLIINYKNIFYLVEILTLCNSDFKMIQKILKDLKYLLYNFDFFKNIPNNIIKTNSKKNFINYYFDWKNKFLNNNFYL
jgi:hypothetical protein